MLSFLATLLSLPLPGMLSRQRLHIQRASGLVFSFDIWGCNATKRTRMSHMKLPQRKKPCPGCHAIVKGEVCALFQQTATSVRVLT
jgi:hypothetical protein